MKILFLASGNNVHTERWVNAMAERGHEVHLAYCKNHAPAALRKISDAVVLHSLPFPAPFGYLFNTGSLHGVIKKIAPDIYNAHYASGYGTLARCSKMSPLVLSVWGSDVYEYPFRRKGNLKRIRRNLEWPDQVTSTGEAMARHILTLGAKLRREIAITPFGVKTSHFMKAESGSEREPLIIGTVKSLKPVYGIDTLLRVFAKVSQESKRQLRLQIYGDGPQRGELELLAEELGIAGQVEWHGAIPNTQVPEALKEMQIFACFSRQESFGVSALEAMAAGLPIVATATDGFCEILESGVEGHIGQVDDVEELSKYMLDLIQDGSKRVAMGLRGWEKVRHKYEWADSITIMESVYRGCMQETTKGEDDNCH